MRLELEENYVIKTLDQYNLGICRATERINKDTGETYIEEKVLGYHSTLYGALNSYLKKRVIESEAEDVNEIIKLLTEIKEEISNTLKDK